MRAGVDPGDAVESAAVVQERLATEVGVARKSPRVGTERSADRLPLPSAIASSSVASARGCLGSVASWAFSIVSPGPAIATTRVVSEPGAIPIQIESIGDLLAWRLDRHGDGGALRGGDDRREGNFSATYVRFYLSSTRPPSARALRGLHLRPLASPVDALERAATGEALVVMATIDAVDVSPVAVSAEVKEAPASVDDALDLSEIVHWRVPAGNSATARNSCDNAHVERVHSRRPGARR
ncbi:MAG: hypothetical protein IPG04_37815 [Polyangiaceae bacterium]|nr:hypothetical protein [Polyangiaceae bacterium]